MLVVVGVIVVLVLAFSIRRGGDGSDAGTSSYPTYERDLVERGEAAYQANCASCHGQDGSGDPRAGIPALDGSMHSWHHPDGQIADLIRRGGVQMPAVGAGWSDEDVTAVLAYIKQWWTAEQRAAQAR